LPCLRHRPAPGFIGSHTCKALAAADFLPVAFDAGHAEFMRRGPLVKCDILAAAAAIASVGGSRLPYYLVTVLPGARAVFVGIRRQA
jgi:hypothetical protein